MSLLPATSHANPTTPFWASASGGGGGGGAILVEANNGQWNALTTDPEIMTIYSPLVLPTVSGKYVVQATYNTNAASAGFVKYILTIGDALGNKSISTLATTDNPISLVGGGAGFTTYWNVGDPTPIISMLGQVDLVSTNPILTWTWNIVFYPL